MDGAARVVAVAILIIHPIHTSLQEKNTAKKPCILGSMNHVDRNNFRRDAILPPPRNEFYNPNPAYEPYWPGGVWVFEKLQTTTPKQPDTLCGNACPQLYIDYGLVCGRSKSYVYKTFKDYCELVNEDCQGREKWMIAYRGECSSLKTYPTAQGELVTRAMQYLLDLDVRIEADKNLG